MTPDIKAVWGDDPTAEYLVSEWGPEVFRASALHSLALDDAARQARLAPARDKYQKPVKGAKKK